MENGEWGKEEIDMDRPYKRELKKLLKSIINSASTPAVNLLGQQNLILPTLLRKLELGMCKYMSENLGCG